MEILKILNADGAQQTIKYSARIEPDDEHEWAIVIESDRHGQYRQTRLVKSFFDSSEYRAIAALGDEMRRWIGPGAVVRRSDRETEINSFYDALE